jgi:hypothetical protein
MTSVRQITANRLNSLKSTGPKTENGKRKSRRNALRHGLCAETVIEILEDIEDYKGFEAAVVADYEAQTAVERELVLRLASLLWRIRRATAIETDLLRTQAELLQDRKYRRELCNDEQSQSILYRLFRTAVLLRGRKKPESDCDETQPAHDPSGQSFSIAVTLNGSRELSGTFQRVSDHNNVAFDRLGRYESALWRQIAQTLFVLQSAKRR